MASPMDDWRSPNQRKIVIQKLEESIKGLGNPPANLQNPIEVEKAFFEKSKNKEEYMNYFRNVILMLSQRQKQTHQQGGTPMMNQARPMMGMGPGQPPMGMNQPNPGYQQPYNQFGGMGGPPNQVSANPNYPPGGMGGPQRPQQPPQYHSGMYNPGGNPGTGMHMSPQQPRYPGNMGMSQGYPQGRPMMSPNFSSHHSMPGMMGNVSGGGYNPMSGGHFNQPPMIGGQGGGSMPPPHGGLMRAPMMQNPMRTMPPRPGMPNQIRSSQPPFMVDGVGVQPVEAVPNPSYSSSVRPSVSSQAFTSASTGSQLMSQQGSVPSPYSNISSPKPAPPTSMAPGGAGSSVPPGDPSQQPQPQQQQQQQQQGHQHPPTGQNPPTPHLPGPVPSPAPPTPLYPASPATSGVGSPATQPAMTPEENEAYIRKLGELQKYVPIMSKWINKMSKDGQKTDQFLKLKSLYNLLQDNNRRVPLQTLIKCGLALEKMFDKQPTDSSDPPLSVKAPTSIPPTSVPPTASAMPISEPVVPEPKFSTSPQSQSLLDFKMVHSPPASSSNLMDTMQSRVFPHDETTLPILKKYLAKKEDLPYPSSLRLELPHLKMFDIQFLPKEDKFDKTTYLKCTITDEDLPKVPPLNVTLPANYPTFSPICDLSNYQNTTPFIEEVGRLLADQISKRMAMFSLVTLMDDWELSILRAMSKILNSEDD